MRARSVAVDLVRAGFGFASRSAKRIDRWTDLDIDETGLLLRRLRDLAQADGDVAKALKADVRRD